MELLERHPALYRRYFRGAVPVDPAVDMVELLTLDASYSCRNEGMTNAGRKAANSQASSSAVPLLSLGSNGSLDAVERVANMFMDQMQKMQQAQQQMVTMFMGGQQASLPSGTLRSLSIGGPGDLGLPNTRSLQLRRVPTSDMPALQRGGPLVEEMPESGLPAETPPAGHRIEETSSEASPAGSRTETALAAVSPAGSLVEQPPTAIADGAQLLDALLERDSEKRKAAAEAKKAANAAAAEAKK